MTRDEVIVILRVLHGLMPSFTKEQALVIGPKLQEMDQTAANALVQAYATENQFFQLPSFLAALARATGQTVGGPTQREVESDRMTEYRDKMRDWEANKAGSTVFDWIKSWDENDLREIHRLAVEDGTPPGAMRAKFLDADPKTHKPLAFLIMAYYQKCGGRVSL